jgi:hypothetical protein
MAGSEQVDATNIDQPNSLNNIRRFGPKQRRQILPLNTNNFNVGLSDEFDVESNELLDEVSLKITLMGHFH